MTQQQAMPKKKHNIPENVLSLFWDLASLDKGVRERAAASLSQKVIADQKAYSKNPQPHEQTNDSNGKQFTQLASILNTSSPLVLYTIRRLCQGLASSRKGARQGFATALGSLLENADWITPDQSVAVVDVLLSPSSSAKKSEIKDGLIAQLFALGAIVRASKKLDGNAGVSTAQKLVQIADKRSFLRQAACSLLVDLANKMKDADIKLVFEQVSGLKIMLTTPASKATPEALFLALKLWGRLPADIRTACSLLPSTSMAITSALWRQGVQQRNEEFQAAAAAVLTKEHITTLLPVLHATTSTHPKMHTVWETLLELLIPGYHASEQASSTVASMGKSQLEALWSVAVEGDIFASSSHERKYLGLLLFREIIPYTKPEHVDVLFSPAFLKTLELNLAHKDTYLHASAKKCLEALDSLKTTEGGSALLTSITARVNKNDHRALHAHLRSLVAVEKPAKEQKKAAPPATETTDVSARLKQLQADFAAAAVHLSDDEDTSVEYEQKIHSIVNELGALVKRNDVEQGSKTKILDFMAAHAFGPDEPSAQDKKLLTKHGVSSYVHLIPSLRQLCTSRVIALTESLSKVGSNQRGENRQQNQTNDGEDILLHVADFAVQLQSQHADDDVQKEKLESWASLRKQLSSAAKQKPTAGANQSNAGGILALEHLVALTQLYLAADSTLIDGDLAVDLSGACNELLGTSGKQKSKKSTDDEDVPHAMDVLVDVLLSLVARTYAPYPSAPARDTGERVFRAFCDGLTETGLNDMLAILTRPMEALAADDEEDEEMEDAEGEDSEEEEDKDDGEEEDNASEGSESADEEEEEEAGKTDEDSDDDDENATDEQMFQIDDKLAAYFSAMRTDRSGQKSQQQEEINFKLRIMAWLEAFIKKVPDSPLLPVAVEPLLTALLASQKGSGNKVLTERLSGVIQHRLCKSKAEASGAHVEEEVVKSALHRALYLASRSDNKTVCNVAGAAYIYTQRVALGTASKKETVPNVAVESLNVALHDFFDKKKTRLSHKVLSELFLRVPAIALVALEELLKQAAHARNEFLKLEAYSLVEVAVQSVKGSLASKASALAAAFDEVILTAVNGPFSKPPKHMQALKTCCQLAIALNTHCGGATKVLSAVVVEAAKNAESENSKVEGQLQRLSNLLSNAEVKGKKRGQAKGAANDAGAKGGNKKPKRASQRK